MINSTQHEGQWFPTLPVFLSTVAKVTLFFPVFLPETYMHLAPGGEFSFFGVMDEDML
ncbi:MAG: hypothetical protein HGB09_07995 [Chlorobiaceae bacterium]|nr:hypothetical protein [Chlorobiaceae bacterium]